MDFSNDPRIEKVARALAGFIDAYNRAGAPDAVNRDGWDLGLAGMLLEDAEEFAREDGRPLIWAFILGQASALIDNAHEAWAENRDTAERDAAIAFVTAALAWDEARLPDADAEVVA